MVTCFKITFSLPIIFIYFYLYSAVLSIYEFHMLTLSFSNKPLSVYPFSKETRFKCRGFER